jgi:hypothetical protein
MPMRAYPPPYPATIDPVTIGEPTSEQKITKSIQLKLPLAPICMPKKRLSLA